MLDMCDRIRSKVALMFKLASALMSVPSVMTYEVVGNTYLWFSLAYLEVLHATVSIRKFKALD